MQSENLMYLNHAFGVNVTANISLHMVCTTGIINFQQTANETHLCVALSCIRDLSERLLQTNLK